MRTVLLVAVLATGCVTDMGDDAAPGDDIGTSARVSLNGLVLNRSLLGDVAKGSLTSVPTRVPTLLSSADGREQFSYLVSCSMRSDKKIVATVSGVSYTFQGSLGLATEWDTAALPTTKYRLISACMLARTNYQGVQVAISMRGKKFTTSSTEQLAYTVVEGAFWGDVFTQNGVVRACASPTKLSGSTVSTLPLRQCTVSTDGINTLCGFGYAGDCSTVCLYKDTKIGFSDCEGFGGDTIAVYLAKP